jgi:hypothetical protein
MSNAGSDYALDIRSLPETIMLGKGYRQRYWTGEIELRLSIDGVPVPPSAVGIREATAQMTTEE